jgi:hypothetical protein
MRGSSVDSGAFSCIRMISSKWRAENRYEPASIVKGTFRAAAWRFSHLGLTRSMMAASSAV